ncbi:hypothetical protein NHH73_05610 [Oxalobacteraceae bacterium OTU3CINTB1]|nr:hypothetical protein NHH73_05610 [Oxalobacteraceae bacterium OTU3CINTB1]
MVKMNRSVSIRLLCIGVLLGAATASATADNYAERHERLKTIEADNFKADLSTREAADRVATSYLGLFGNVDVTSVKDQPEMLKSLFDASSMAAFYTDDAYYAKKMHQYFDLLKSAGSDETSGGVKVYGAYLAAEEFEAATRFSAAHPGLNVVPLPVIVAQQASSGLQEWIIDADGKKLSSATFVLPPGPYMMVASSIHCHFSLDSMRALQSFPDLDRLSGRSKWLMRIERSTNFAEIAQWNNTHPKFQFSVPRKYATWTGISHWDTPTFYFFNNAKLVYKFSGWPATGNMDKIKRGMSEAGFYRSPQ